MQRVILAAVQTVMSKDECFNKRNVSCDFFFNPVLTKHSHLNIYHKYRFKGSMFDIEYHSVRGIFQLRMLTVPQTYDREKRKKL